jgi:hypothetical protein
VVTAPYYAPCSCARRKQLYLRVWRFHENNKVRRGAGRRREVEVQMHICTDIDTSSGRSEKHTSQLALIHYIEFEVGV